MAGWVKRRWLGLDVVDKVVVSLLAATLLALTVFAVAVLDDVHRGTTCDRTALDGLGNGAADLLVIGVGAGVVAGIVASIHRPRRVGISGIVADLGLILAGLYLWGVAFSTGPFFC